MPIQRLQLDLTGQRADNRITNETRVLPNKKVRCIAPDYGPFFKGSFKLWDSSTQQEVPTSSLKFQFLEPLATAEAGGQEVVCLAIITDESVSSNVHFEYQAVGAIYQRSCDTLRQLADALLADDRPILWPSILNKPINFAVTEHYQNAANAIGMESLVAALNAVRMALIAGDQQDHIEILNYFDAQLLLIHQQFQSQIDADLAAALAAAHAAKTASDANTANVNAVLTASASAVAQAALSAAKANTVDLAQQDAVAQAQAMLDAVLANRGGVKVPPYDSSVIQVTAPTHLPASWIDEDYFTLDACGQIHYAGDVVTAGQAPDVLRVSLKASKNATTQATTLEISLAAIDARERLYYQEILNPALNFSGTLVNDGVGDHYVYLSGGSGYRCSNEVNVVIDPLNLSGYRPSTGLVDDVRNILTPVKPSAGSMSVTFHGLAAQQLSLPGYKPGDARPSYWVLGTDDPLIDQRLDALPSAVIAQKILNSLLDMRSDYNMLDYGSVDKRRAVKFRMYPGTIITLACELQAPAGADLMRNVTMSVMKSLSVVRTDHWEVEASGGQLNALVPVQTTVIQDIDRQRVRSVSVRIDDAPAATNALASVSEVVNEPVYFIADQFEVSLSVLDATGTGRRQLHVKNRSSAVMSVTSGWLEVGATQTKLHDDLSVADQQVEPYSHTSHAVIDFPVTGAGTEYIRWYLDNGQNVTFAVTPGSNSVITLIGAGVEPVSYFPVFDAVTVLPDSVLATGEQGTIRLSFSNMEPNTQALVHLEAISPGLPGVAVGNKTIAVDGDGNGYLDLPVTGTSAASVSRAIRAQSVTRNITITRDYQAQFTQMVSSASTGWDGQSYDVTLTFEGLSPSVNTTLYLTMAPTGMTGPTGLSAYTVTADAQGVANVYLEYTLTQAVTELSVTYGSTTRQVATVGPTLVSAQFSPAGQVAGGSISLTASFEQLKPSAINTIAVTVTAVSGSYDGPAGVQNLSVIADSMGNGTSTGLMATMPASDLSVKITHNAVEKTAVAQRQYNPAITTVDLRNGATSVNECWEDEIITSHVAIVGAQPNAGWSRRITPIHDKLSFSSALLDGNQQILVDGLANGSGEIDWQLALQATTPGIGSFGLQLDANTSVVDYITIKKVLDALATSLNLSMSAAIDGADNDTATLGLSVASGLTLTATRQTVKNSTVTGQDNTTGVAAFTETDAGVNAADYRLRLLNSSNLGEIAARTLNQSSELVNLTLNKTANLTQTTATYQLQMVHIPTGRVVGSRSLVLTVSNTKSPIAIGNANGQTAYAVQVTPVNVVYNREHYQTSIRLDFMPNGRLQIQSIGYGQSNQHVLEGVWAQSSGVTDFTSRSSEFGVRISTANLQEVVQVLSNAANPTPRKMSESPYVLLAGSDAYAKPVGQVTAQIYHISSNQLVKTFTFDLSWAQSGGDVGGGSGGGTNNNPN